jgi:diguanylate cyclase (GGDEF)-like protein
MIRRFRGGQFSVVDPELRPYRARVARLTTFILGCLLAIWLIVDTFYLRPTGAILQVAFYFHIIAIVFLAISTAFAARNTRRGEFSAAGTILAFSIFLVALLWMFIFPRDILIVSALLICPILISGAVIGGRSTFVFAALGALATLGGWWRVKEVLPDFFSRASPFTDLSFITTQIAVYFLIAALLYSFSRNIERTITRLRTQTEQLTQLANTDPLTGLANRRYLIAQLERVFTGARRYHRPLSLLYIDLDGFKGINDRYGHIVGDEILHSIALAMQAVLRSTDLIARIGGDEFALLLPETNLKGSEGVVNKLQRAMLAFSSNLGPSMPRITFCAGIAQMREDDEGIDDMLARADQAQYLAKTSGKAQVRSQADVSQLPLFDPEGESAPSG